MRLQHLCDHSVWQNIGRRDLITNLSSYVFSQTQEEALGIGLKFATNIHHKSLIDYIGKNYNWREKDLENGFKQGVLLCSSIMARDREFSIPRRYIRTLRELQNYDDIIVTTADKGGGVVILNKSDYINKMEELLGDTDTYSTQRIGQALVETKFKQDVRGVLRRSEKGKNYYIYLKRTRRFQE
ncbi:uncharacterized protein LOC143037808 [Oratosquilla oratoria]|uniref:uncharacterized protein LOC143037808 n=1 Tax=Oratosquilla oratoria TaxID=337810 RepID=UPI003F7637B8